ncbi:7241_t:CDS:2 [Gigaspora margarita]|uniref:7241_t:CDS:1 n=1 Tax=Gigaspora margarita TaxID=4874 RepID=A0ABN7WNZ6_GIGMA|nr:7241_t:CDS:2 [Gigaspora margarita]
MDPQISFSLLPLVSYDVGPQLKVLDEFKENILDVDVAGYF